MVQEKTQARGQTAQAIPSFRVGEIVEARDGSTLIWMELEPMRYGAGDTKAAGGGGATQAWTNARGQVQAQGHILFRVQDVSALGTKLYPGAELPLGEFCGLIEQLYHTAPQQQT